MFKSGKSEHNRTTLISSDPANPCCVVSHKQSSLVKTLAYASKTQTGHCPSCSSVPWKKINTGSVFRRHKSAQSNSHHRGSGPGSGSLRLIPCGDPLKSHMSRGQLTARFHFATFTLQWKNPQVSLTFLSWFFSNFYLSIFHPIHHLPLRCKFRTSTVSFESCLISHTRGLTVGKWIESERQRWRVCVLQIRWYSLKRWQNKMRVSAFILSTTAQRIPFWKKVVTVNIIHILSLLLYQHLSK